MVNARTGERAWRRGLTVVAVGALVLAACGDDDEPAPAGAGDEEEAAADADGLTILEWAGYEDPGFYPGFAEDRADVELDFQFGDSDADFLTKVQAGGVSPDIIHPCAGWIGLWQQDGLIHPIDTDLLEHWDDLDEQMRSLGEIDGEYYFVPFDWGYTSLVVAVDRVDEVPDSWQDLWDPQYQNRISVWNDAEEAVMMTAYAWGLDPYDLDEDDTEFVSQKLQELHGQVLTYWEDVAGLDQMMIDGEVDVAQAWNETLAAMEEAGVDGAYIDPAEGRLGWVCGFAVAAEPGTPEYELAHEYIDATIAPDAGQYLIDSYYYGHSNLRSIEVADPEVVELIELDQPDIRERTNFYQPLTQEQRETWSRLWAEATAG